MNKRGYTSTPQHMPTWQTGTTFTFTGTVLFASSPCPQSTQLSTLSVLWDYSEEKVRHQVQFTPYAQ
jgi:hypothetical protein